MTRQEAFDEINKTQDYYVEELINKINDPDYVSMKTISFTSPTGTGKTKMMSKLINRFPDYYFIITTLSKGQLHIQVRDSLQQDCKWDNFTVYGSADYKINSLLDATDIISKIPQGTKCIWLRDEGHIKTNRFEELLLDKCYKIINISATNIRSDILCNFIHTMMLRTVNQTTGTPEDAIRKLLEIKKSHKNISNYNPCAIIRCISGKNDIYNDVVELCEKNKLKYIDITEDPYVMAELCEDDNEYDVIINKFKIVEGIDIRRAHVLYMDNQPSNNATTIQAIGRCRRNALLYRHDIDILAPENKKLLEDTRECYVYYNVKSMKIDTDSDGELYYAFCNYISCEALKTGSRIYVNNGRLSNGLYVIELEGETGWFDIVQDTVTGFNIVSPETNFYKEEVLSNQDEYDKYIYIKYFRKIKKDEGINSNNLELYDVKKILFTNIKKLPLSIGKDMYENFHFKNTSLNQDVYILHFWNEKDRGFYLYINFYEKNYQQQMYYDLDCRNYQDTPQFQKLFESISEEEMLSISKAPYGNGYSVIDSHYGSYGCFIFPERYYKSWNKDYSYKDYKKIVNDKESAVIGTDLMKPIKQEENILWIESKSITSKIDNYNKLNVFITKRYCDELNSIKEYLFSGKNTFEFDKKCNSMLGYCVEYYSKYLVYGESYLGENLSNARDECKYENYKYIKDTDYVAVRACILKYQDMMKRTFGDGVVKYIKSITINSLIQDKYKTFVKTIVELGTKTAEYVIKTLYAEKEPLNNVDPNLSIRHISGLADYITEDTILDIKVLNHIDEKCIRQVLAYHYLSTKRSDLHIKRVIVYDAVSGKSVVVNITDKNLV